MGSPGLHQALEPFASCQVNPRAGWKVCRSPCASLNALFSGPALLFCSFSFRLLRLFPQSLPHPRLWVWLCCYNKVVLWARFLTSESQSFSCRMNHPPGKA